jgi:hypothetical protein
VQIIKELSELFNKQIDLYSKKINIEFYDGEWVFKILDEKPEDRKRKAEV